MNPQILTTIAFAIAACLAILFGYYWQCLYVELEKRHTDALVRLSDALDGWKRSEQREHEWEALCSKWEGLCEETKRERDRVIEERDFDRSIKIPNSLHYLN